MDDLSAFLAENVEKIPNKKVVISKRFKDKKGKPIEWEIRAISSEENNDILRSCMVQRRLPNGKVVREQDGVKYINSLLATSVVYPDLYDAKLQDSYKVKTPEALLSKMLYPSELDALGKEVMEISEIEELTEDLISDAKN